LPGRPIPVEGQRLALGALSPHRQGSMFGAQRAEFSGSEHIELPGRAPQSWLQAFAGSRQHQPAPTLSSILYLRTDGEDYQTSAHWRAQPVGDAIKDTGRHAGSELGPVWERQVELRKLAKLSTARLRAAEAEFGVNWALVSYPAGG